MAGVCLLLVAGVPLASRYAPITGHLALIGVVVSPFLMVSAPLAVVVLLWGRDWLLAAGAGCLSVALCAVQLPLYVADPSNPNSVAVRVMTANLLFGQANSRAVAELAGAHADVVMLQELTPEAVRGLSAAGIDAVFPYQALDARAQAAGVGIYSRYPIMGSDPIGGYELGMMSARIRVRGVDATVVSMHLPGPWPQPIDGWRRDIARFPHTLADLAAAAGDGAVIVGGDFNATVDMRPFRELLVNGYREAAEQSGAGRTFSYPNGRWLPAVIGIDHVLTRMCTAVSARSVGVTGSDHRAVLATVSLPRG